MSARTLVLLAASLLVPSSLAGAADAIRIDCDFPGGNIVVEEIEGDVVRLRPDLRDTAGWWFWWYFRVQGAEGRTLKFEFTDAGPVGVRGPAVSSDGGRSWSWATGKADTKSFSHEFAAGAGETRFAFAIPYLQADWDRFLAGYGEHRSLRPEVLCQSDRERSVESLYVVPSGTPQHRVLVTARNHACESVAGFVLEGMLQAVLAAESDEMRWLGEHAELLVVPFVDKDGVEDGDQGKNRRPRDHNRDYDGQSVHAETRALRSLVPTWRPDLPLVTLDIHCPWIRGKRNEEIYIVGSSDSRIWGQQQRLGRLLEACRQGPLPYRAEDNLPFGVDWNKGSNFQQGMSCSRWGAEVLGARLAASFEVPYANVHGVAVTANAGRAFGRDLALALARYLREPQ